MMLLGFRILHLNFKKGLRDADTKAKPKLNPS